MRRRLLVGAMSVAGHALVLFALLPARPTAPRTFDPGPITVASLVPPPRPPRLETPELASAGASPAPPAARPASAKPAPRRALTRPSPAPAVLTPVPAALAPPGDAADEVSDGELAGAATAGSGSGSGSGAGAGGGTCDMTRWLQDKLRKDRLVQAAVAQAHRGKAIRVWNGDWVRRADQDGAGLAAVREAMMWEIAFAPAACRTKQVHGLVMISLADGPGAARLVVGSGDWRWSDLLALKRR